MKLHILINLVYQMTPRQIGSAVLVLTFCLFCLQQRLGKSLWWRRGLVCLLTLWSAALLAATLLNRSGGGDGVFQWSLFQSYREVFAGGDRERLRSNFMNVLLFYPGGLLLSMLLPKKWPLWGRLLMVLSGSFLLSFAIELAQLRFDLGLSEADDIFHNTLGAVLGCLCSRPHPVLLQDIDIPEGNHE